MKDKGNKKSIKKPSEDKNSKQNAKNRDVIVKSCASMVLPIALILGAYVILHGHLSPGGGFQGGVLIGGAVAILYAAYGRTGIQQMFHLGRMKASESIGALGFLFVASLGIIYGVSGFRFFSNVISRGTPGELYSSGTIFWMNFAVGYKVLAGIGALIFIMVSTLNSSEE